MTKDEILKQVRLDLPILKNDFGVKRIGLFGSYATSSNKPESDIDIFVELNPPYADHYFHLLFFLEKKFNKPVGSCQAGNSFTRPIFEAN